MEQIEADMADLPENRARLLASTALLLGRIAYADGKISSAEQERMTLILEKELKLSPVRAQAVTRLVVTLTLEDHRENHLVLRQIKELTTRAEQVDLLRALLAVASEDDISQVEDMEIRKVSDYLGFSHKEYIALRSEFREYLSVLKSK